MKVSVQGSYYSKVNEMYTRYEFRPGFYEKGRHSEQVTDSETGKSTGITHGPSNVELLHNIKLVIHIVPEKEEFLEIIDNGLKKPKQYLSLGRWEDLLVIENVEIVDLIEKKLDEDYILKYDAYVPKGTFKEKDESSMATIYRINKKYSINEKTKIRKWDEIIYVKHMSKKSRIYTRTDVLCDGEDLVFLA